MSHISTVELEIRNLKALEDACAKLGATLNTGKKTYIAYYGEKPCDHAITHPRAKYSVGVKANQDGTFSLEMDTWSSGGLTGVFGTDMSKLKQRYGATLARKQLAREGFRVRETEMETGELKLTATRM